MAKLHQQVGEFDKAANWYQTAIKENPTDAKIGLAYATFLWKVEKNTTDAQDLALDIYKSQKNHYELNLLLAELAVANQQYDAARNYLSVLDKVDNHNFSKRLSDLNEQIAHRKS